MSIPHMEQQHEGQEHPFLGYQHVDIFFVFSFCWDVSKYSWKRLKSELADESKGWITPRLHDRALYDNEVELFASYQPNLVGPQRVLERTHLIQRNASIIIPTDKRPSVDASLESGSHKLIRSPLRYTVRLFDNGAATCTFQICLRRTKDDTDASMFEKIHAVLHLARNVDYVSPEHRPGGSETTHLTDAYLAAPINALSEEKEDLSLFPKNQSYCSIHDLFRQLFSNLDGPNWMPQDISGFWADKDVLDTKDNSQEFQSPFIITVAEVERNSFLRFRKHPTLDAAREIASIICKLTLDNRWIVEDYLHLSEDYITQILKYNPSRGGITNYCLDRRLFFSFSKRGALAITADVRDLPSCFVIPSFVNLHEIMRARWHMACLLNMRIDALIDCLGENSLSSKEASVQSKERMIALLREMRMSYTLFLKDPLPYLFDSGSVTEIAKVAMTELGLDALSDAIHRKMKILDAIRQDIEDEERLRRREQFDLEFKAFTASGPAQDEDASH